MELWMKIVYAVLLGMMVVFLAPRARQMLKDSAEQEKDWKGVILPLLAVVLFIVLLISSV